MPSSFRRLLEGEELGLDCVWFALLCFVGVMFGLVWFGWFGSVGFGSIGWGWLDFFFF